MSAATCLEHATPLTDESRRFSRALFVTCTYPEDFEKSVFGVYLRMRTFLQALCELTDRLEVLFISSRIDGDVEAARRKVESSMRARWGIHADVFLVRIPRVDGAAAWREHYLEPALSLRRNENYAGLDAPAVLNAIEERLARGPDLVFAHRLQAAVPFLLLRDAARARMFFDLDDVEHRKLLGALAVPPHYPGKWLYALRALPMMLGERRAARAAARTFVCSDEDCGVLRMLRYPRVAVIGNAVDVPPHIAPVPPSRQLLFLGTYTYEPNIVAAEYLVSEVWPIVREAAPEAHLVIAGNRPERIPSFRRKPQGVRYTGFVEDLAPLYAQAQVVCCPVQSGGGTRIKIIEAAAYARAVVSTTAGARGLAFRAGTEIVLADTPALFAGACIRLLKDVALASVIGGAAWRRARAMYSRATTIRTIKREIVASMEEVAA
ncbi:MAG TPA: glycosyltransferase [Burkholderiales bacterium]|nr:glycosyltransferase [Burkholderiales bacterium]